MDTNIGKIITNFFDKLQISYDSLDLSTEENDIFSIKLKTSDSGVLIGPHGKNLEAIEQILKLLISKTLDKKVKLHLEINDYMRTKEEKLFSFVKNKIELLKNGKDDIRLPFLNAYERKKIHSYISELNDSTIYTKSIGEGVERRLHICKVDKKITIDIDGDDI